MAFESVLNVDKLTFIDSTLPFLELISARADIKRLILDSVTSESRMITVDSADNLKIDGLTMRGVYSANSKPLEIYRSSVTLLANIHIFDLSQAPVSIKNSRVEVVDSLRLTNCSSTATIENSVVNVIANSTFEQ